MIKWKEYEIKKFPRYCHKGKWYTQAIMSFDTETTTYYNVNGEWVSQDYNKDPDIYSEADKFALVYIWQLNINGDVIYGREITEFFAFWEKFRAVNNATTIVYVHNLGFDFDFLCEYMPKDTTVFARGAYRPMYAKSEEMRIEFRCSYFLTNMSLEAVAKQFKLSSQKQAGELVYNIARTPNTELTEQELNYCEYDVRVINELIEKVFLIEYHSVANIPLTQTGIVRRMVKARLLENKYHQWEMRKLKPDIEQYKVLTSLLQGGYTHLNYIYNDVILSNVASFDKSSSYPDVMCTRKFPIGQFREVLRYFENDDRCAYYMYIRAAKIHAKGAWNYIARHKLTKSLNIINDNGKVQRAEYMEMWATDIDYEIIKNNYIIEDGGYIEIVKVYSARKDYLPKTLIEIILKLYDDKTELKGIEERYAFYMRQKQMLNCIFGMCITNNIRDEITYNPLTEQWEEEQLTDEDITNKLNAEKPFLSFAWGIWVTAWARHDLWQLISKISCDCVYCDTDSVKILNEEKYKKYIEEYNKECDNRIEEVCKELNLPKEKFYPKDIKGKIHALGYFEYEGNYDKFLSLGSKKYCYEIDGHFNYTVAGLRKKYIDVDGEHVTMTSISEFKIDNKIKNGRMVHWHLDHLTPTTLTDYNGAEYMATNTRGMAMLNTNYTFSVSKDYAEFLADTRDKYRTPFRIYY